MKYFLFGAFALFSIDATASEFRSPEPVVNPASVLLKKMRQASEQLSYESTYILVRKNTIEPLRYRHSIIDNKTYSQLLYLSGPPREIIQRGNEVSYIEAGIDPYTIKSNKITAPLPTIIHANIAQLSPLYNFVSLGKSREAGVGCDVVRVTPKDGERYAFLLWIDDQTNLLVRADLLDRDGEPIEQYRALSVNHSDKIADDMKVLLDAELPSVMTLPKQEKQDLFWYVSGLPDGFQSISKNRHRLMMTGVPVESQMFSDGLFSFSVYLAKADDFSVSEQLVRKGRRTLHSHLMGDTEVTVVGDIPPSTAKKIAESVRFEHQGNNISSSSSLQK